MAGGTADGRTADGRTAAERGAKRAPRGCVWLQEGDEWAIGNTANYAMAVAVANGSDLRALHQGGSEQYRAAEAGDMRGGGRLAARRRGLPLPQGRVAG